MKKTLLALSILIGFYANAADNSVYIDQTGDYSIITVTQDGSGNRLRGILINGTAGGNTDRAVLDGNNQTISISQVGANNILSLGLKTTVTSGNGITLSYTAIDGGNTAYINSNNPGTGISSNNNVTINQSGGSAITNLNLLGSGNGITVNQAGGSGNKFDATINADQTSVLLNQTGGGGNETTLALTGNKGNISIASVGAANITNITQSAFGINGASVNMNITGSGNDTTITQSGLFDHSVSMTVTGNDNIFSIAQSGGTSAGQIAILNVTGGNNNVSITQQGTKDNTSNLAINGNYNTYTIIQK